MESAHTASRQNDCLLLVVGRSVVLQRNKLELGSGGRHVKRKENKTSVEY